MEAVVDGKTIQLSEAGWLENLDEWSEALAPEIANLISGNLSLSCSRNGKSMYVPPMLMKTRRSVEATERASRVSDTLVLNVRAIGPSR